MTPRREQPDYFKEAIAALQTANGNLHSVCNEYEKDIQRLQQENQRLKDVRIPCEHVGQDIALSRCPKCNYEVAKAGLESLRQQLDAREEEIARLKRGDFTPEEFQALCHNRNEMPGCTRADFEEGCRLYQKKLFGE